jgi:exopolysaccharide biosynthesis WecB/TagA/CpsF family protein
MDTATINAAATKSSTLDVAALDTAAPDTAVAWPYKYGLFGVQVSAATCDEACESILRAARRRLPAVVSAFSVHALVEAATKLDLQNHANRFAVITPDGQPVRWALNWLHGTRLRHNVRGSELMWRLCERASELGVSIYLYGSSPATLAALRANLQRALPALEIAGAESPPFRSLSVEEDAAMVRRVNDSGAGLMFLGLGCPKQDYFAAEHVDRIRAVQLCVGAAFDFHAGTKATAPEWMQRCGLEWLFRLYQEPGRLWKRYLVTNSVFIAKLLTQLFRQHLLPGHTGAAESFASGDLQRDLTAGLRLDVTADTPRNHAPLSSTVEKKSLS